MRDKVTSQWLETLVNRYLALDPEALKNMAELKGKVICVDVSGINKRYYIFPEDERIAISAHHDGEPDTTIRGLPSALLRLRLHDDTAPLMLSGEIEIIGDVRLGREFKKCLSNLNIDWEEQLSAAIGDVPANIAFNVFNQISSWTKKASSSFQADLSEYLQEESRDVVTSVELDDFNAKVDQLRDDVDRVAALIKKSKKK